MLWICISPNLPTVPAHQKSLIRRYIFRSYHRKASQTWRAGRNARVWATLIGAIMMSVFLPLWRRPHGLGSTMPSSGVTLPVAGTRRWNLMGVLFVSLSICAENPTITFLRAKGTHMKGADLKLEATPRWIQGVSKGVTTVFALDIVFVLCLRKG